MYLPHRLHGPMKYCLSLGIRVHQNRTIPYPMWMTWREHSIQFHHYADDLQLYAHFDLNKISLESTISRMQDCICDVQSWFSNNKLKMNPYTTLFLDFVPPYYNKLVDNINIKIGSSDINVVSSVTNLGVRLDRN